MRTRRIITIATALLWASTALAVTPPTPATSLNTCQGQVKGAAKTYVDGYVSAVATCLQAISLQVIQKNAADAHLAAGTCVTQFRKIHDTRGLGGSLGEKLVVAVDKKCAPGMPNVTHTLADILGTGAGVAQPIEGENLDTWCTHFAGDGSIDTLHEWTDCVAASHTCAAQQAIVTQYPRALEWLAAVRSVMMGQTPPAKDPTKISDAIAGLNAVVAAIDGPDGDGQPGIVCPPSPGVCGNGVAEIGEECDGANFGQTCEGLGYSLGGTLACTAGCRFDVSGCVTPLNPPAATGQTTCYNSSGAVIQCFATGQDGELQKGFPRGAYTDNGDGTITDDKTGLMWEKKSYDGSIHDWGASYSWNDAFAVFIAGLNSANFAGHNDWRLPNINELLSLVDYGASNHALNAVFNTSCTAGCTVTTCDCDPDGYWSSTTVAAARSYAWAFQTWDGASYYSYKVRYRPDGSLDSNYFSGVRAVRGGL